MLPVVVVLGSVIPSILWPCYLHTTEHKDSVNIVALSLIGFLVVNLLICLWELCLCYRFDVIQKVYQKRLKEGQLNTRIFLFRHHPWSDAFSPSMWAHIWIDYCRWDPSYADGTTLGFCIDVGNGHTTILPSLFILCSIISPICGPRVTGIVGVITFYQIFYGTCLYFFQFTFNGRYKKCDAVGITIVVIANLIWIVFPYLGFKDCCSLIMDDSFAVWHAR